MWVTSFSEGHCGIVILSPKVTCHTSLGRAEKHDKSLHWSQRFFSFEFKFIFKKLFLPVTVFRKWWFNPRGVENSLFHYVKIWVHVDPEDLLSKSNAINTKRGGHRAWMFITTVILTLSTSFSRLPISLPPAKLTSWISLFFRGPLRIHVHICFGDSPGHFFGLPKWID